MTMQIPQRFMKRRNRGGTPGSINVPLYLGDSIIVGLEGNMLVRFSCIT